jgi:hypothetical protein
LHLHIIISPQLEQKNFTDFSLGNIDLSHELQIGI